jgi:hypothetical protein
MPDKGSTGRRLWALAVLGYVALAAALTWPLGLHLGGAVLGIPQVDQMDTAWLRLAVSRGLMHPSTWPWSTEIQAPAGYPLGHLVPNLVDHATGAPFALWLPWPVGDNLWWILALAANGLAAHALGRQIGGSHAAGALCGVLFTACEPVLREANLGHAPQALLVASPLYVGALTRMVGPAGRGRDAVLAGGLLAFAAMTYWYQGAFLVVMSIPVAFARDRGAVQRLAAALGLGAVLCAVPLGAYLAFGDGIPDAAGGSRAGAADPALWQVADLVPARHRWTFSQASDALWPLRPTPLDRSNRLSVALVGAAILGGLASPAGRRWPWLAAALTGAVLALGPYLKYGDEPLLIGGAPIPLPGAALADVLPGYARLSWPQRWGVIVVLALLPLAARAPRPGVWAALALLETFSLSGNAPLQTTPVEAYDGWRSLAATEGSVMVLPLDRLGPKGPLLGFIYRATRRPLVAQMTVPPGATEPEAWLAWRRASPFARWLDARQRPGAAYVALDPGALDALVAEGVDAIAVDRTPGGMTSEAGADALVRLLSRALGEPLDYGSAEVWWIDPPAHVAAPLADPDGWRSQQRGKLSSRTAVPLRTVVRPVPLD